MTVERFDKIAACVVLGCELIAALRDHGEINSAQAKVIINSAVMAKIPNAKDDEIKAAARVVQAEICK